MGNLHGSERLYAMVVSGLRSWGVFSLDLDGWQVGWREEVMFGLFPHVYCLLLCSVFIATQYPILLTESTCIN